MGNITVFSAAMAVLAFSREALENAFPTHAFVRAAIPHVVTIQPCRHTHTLHTVKRQIKMNLYRIDKIT